MKIAIVGTQGVPNQYGGFETLATFLAKYLSDQMEMTIYCSSKDMPNGQDLFYKASLRYVKISSHGFSGMLYDMICLYEAVKKNEVVLFLGFGAGYLMPFLTKKQRSKIILNFGGLDWKRDKWNWLAKRIIYFSERLLVKNSSHIVADNAAIEKYVEASYQKKSSLIAYGGDQAFKQDYTELDFEKFPFLEQPYAFSVCRIQSDNQIELLLSSFEQTNIPFVMVGNWESSSFGRKIRKKYQHNSHLFLQDAIYDPATLNKLRSNCMLYMHGHSSGGTNPSLVEAMYLGLPIAAFASGYNEIVTLHNALYFKDSVSLIELLNKIDSFNLKSIGEAMKDIATQNFTWNKITAQYHQLFLEVNKANNNG
jgi:glycosyltransferase involved in cell wall biosynthesis